MVGRGVLGVTVGMLKAETEVEESGNPRQE